MKSLASPYESLRKRSQHSNETRLRRQALLRAKQFMCWSDCFQTSLRLEDLLDRPQSDIEMAEKVVETLEHQDAIAFSTRYYDADETLIACYFAERYKASFLCF